MPYALAEFAARNFPQIADRTQREHAAETALVRLFFNNATTGFFVEVGANDPKRLSQSWHLEVAGWTGLLIEPIDALCRELRIQRPGSTVVQAACSAPGSPAEADLFIPDNTAHATLDAGCGTADSKPLRRERVKLMTLDQILLAAGQPRVDFLSIDVEGCQLDVLRGLSMERVLPRLLFIEDHLTDLETHRYIESHGYHLVKRTGLNNWYVPKANAPEFRLTTHSERWRLWNKVVVRTPFRKPIQVLKRALKGRPIR